MNKKWETPKLTQHGSFVELTQVSVKDVVKVGKFILPGYGKGLRASLAT